MNGENEVVVADAGKNVRDLERIETGFMGYNGAYTLWETSLIVWRKVLLLGYGNVDEAVFRGFDLAHREAFPEDLDPVWRALCPKSFFLWAKSGLIFRESLRISERRR
jgi:hypothetical protein